MTRTFVVRATALAIGTVAAMTAIGACSSSSGGGAHKAAIGGASIAAPSRGAALSPNPRTLNSVKGISATGSVDSAALHYGASSGGGANAPQSAGSPDIVSTYKIRNAEITVSVAKAADVATAANAADDIATKYNGEVFGDDRNAGPHATAEIVIKVPPDSLHAALNDLAKLGKEKARSESTKDVTSQVIDVDTRVGNLKAAIATLQALFDRPDQKLSDIIRLESELSQRESALESMLAQQRALHAETDTATITISFVTATVAAKHHHKKSGGFIGGLRDGWHAFVKGATATARALGAVIPFAVLLLILGGGLKLLWPRLGISRRPRPEPTPATE